MLTRKNNKAMS